MPVASTLEAVDGAVEVLDGVFGMPDLAVSVSAAEALSRAIPTAPLAGDEAFVLAAVCRIGPLRACPACPLANGPIMLARLARSRAEVVLIPTLAGEVMSRPFISLVDAVVAAVAAAAAAAVADSAGLDADVGTGAVGLE